MKIEVKYKAFVTEQDEPIKADEEVLAAVNGLKDEGANLSQWLDSKFDDLGIDDGSIRIDSDFTNKEICSVITYGCSEFLSKKDLNQLIEQTTAQLMDGYGETPWNIVVRDKSLFINLIDVLGKPVTVSTFEDTDTQTTKKRRSPIFSALETGDLQKAEKYLNQNHLFSTDKWDTTPLMVAIRKGYTALAIKMIEFGANVNHASTKSGGTPLQFAAMAGDDTVIKYLIEYGVDVNEAPIDPEGLLSNVTALMWAANRNHQSVIELLISAGALVNKQDGRGNTALMYAKPDNLKLIECLIKNGADPKICNEEGLDAYHEALNQASMEKEDPLGRMDYAELQENKAKFIKSLYKA